MRALALAALAAFCLTGAGATAAPSIAGRTSFDVTRNGQPFGTHTIVVSGSGESLRAQSTISLRAGLGPLVMFRLEQSCAETWSDGMLAGLRCSTLKDGRRTQVVAQRDGNRLRVEGAEGEIWFPMGVFPTSWWTAPPTDATTLLDTENGEAMHVRVTRLGRESIEVGGRQIEAERIRVRGTLTVDLWYREGRWVGCAFTARGQRIEYRLASPLSAAPA